MSSLRFTELRNCVRNRQDWCKINRYVDLASNETHLLYNKVYNLTEKSETSSENKPHGPIIIL